MHRSHVSAVTKEDGLTHGEGCYTWGLPHYACAIALIAERDRQIRQLQEEKQKLESMVEYAMAGRQ